ncbi:MAG: MFS transporter [Acidimicrobiia bacterium]
MAAAALPFLLDAGTFVVGAALILAMHGNLTPAPDGPPAAMTTRIAEGFRWLWRHRLIRVLAFFAAVWNLAVGAVSAIYVLFALELLGVDEVGFGLLVVTEGVGGLIGTLVAPRLSTRLGTGTTILAATAFQGSAYVVIGLLSDPWVAGVVTAAGNVGALAAIVLVVSLRQSTVPGHLLGRVTSAMRFIAVGAMPLGAVAGGVLGSFLGLRVPSLAAGSVLLGLRLVAAPTINNRAVAAHLVERE